MESIVKVISFILISLIVVPMWCITATLNYFVCNLLYIFTTKQKKDEYYKKNKVVRPNFIDYKQHIKEVVYFY